MLDAGVLMILNFIFVFEHLTVQLVYQQVDSSIQIMCFAGDMQVFASQVQIDFSALALVLFGERVDGEDNGYINDMVKMSIEEIKEIIRPCGLSPMKSKGIHGLSQILIEKHGGEVPQSFEYLEELPAVGHKTASVVMSQAFGVPAFPVDTHIHRLMYRWNLSDGKNVVQTEKDAKRIFPEETWNDLHLQMIWYGREYSPARGWDIEKDIITRTIGKKSVLEEYHKKMSR